MAIRQLGLALDRAASTGSGAEGEPAAPAPESGGPRDDEAPEVEPILDPTALDQLRQLDDGDGEFLRSAIDLFLKDATEKLQDLAAALEARDAAAVEHLAHSLKSSAGHFGGRRMAASCAELERAARDGSLADFGKLGAAIDAELERLADELETQRAALPAG